MSTSIIQEEEEIKSTSRVNQIEDISKSVTDQYLGTSGGSEKNLDSSNGFTKMSKIINKENLYDVSSVSVINKTKNFFKSLQDWIGIVEKINYDKKFFEVKLVDNDKSGTYETAEFDFQDVSPDDLKLLTVGAVFYWSIGYSYDQGQVSKKSLVKFKRSIPLESEDFDDIIDKANNLNSSINWD
jgi:hypothetical protein